MTDIIDIDNVLYLISTTHNTLTNFDVSTNQIQWSYKINDLFGNTEYTFVFDLTHETISYYGNIIDSVSGTYCKQVTNSREVLEMLHAFKDGNTDWDC